MTLKLTMKLLSPKACLKIGQWNVRIMLKLGNCAQVTQERQKRERESQKSMHLFLIGGCIDS